MEQLFFIKRHESVNANEIGIILTIDQKKGNHYHSAHDNHKKFESGSKNKKWKLMNKNSKKALQEFKKDENDLVSIRSNSFHRFSFFSYQSPQKDQKECNAHILKIQADIKREFGNEGQEFTASGQKVC